MSLNFVLYEHFTNHINLLKATDTPMKQVRKLRILPLPPTTSLVRWLRKLTQVFLGGYSVTCGTTLEICVGLQYIVIKDHAARTIDARLGGTR